MARRRLRHPPDGTEILLRDYSHQQSKATAAIDSGFSAKIRKKGERYFNSGWRCITDMLDDRLQICERENVGIDRGLAYSLTHEVVTAKATPKKDAEGNPERFLERIVNILIYPGCRLYMTQDEIAEKYGFCRQHVSKQLNLLKRWGFIVNYGQGWIEFDCRLVWRGDLEIHSAYSDVLRNDVDLRRLRAAMCFGCTASF